MLRPKRSNWYENYSLPVIEGIAAKVCEATVFSIFHIKNGFWHVEMDDESSILTTFNTTFGKYRWKRLPFVISSAPEIFQRRMHELIEDLAGNEVVVTRLGM